MQKKVSFIVPKVNVDGVGRVSKYVVRKLLKYNVIDDTDVKNLIKVNVNGESLPMGSVYCAWDGLSYYILLSGSYLFSIKVDGTITVDKILLSEGDRVDLFFSYENDINIEEQVHKNKEDIKDIDMGNYYTKTEIDSMVGDIETALDAILGV